MILLNRRALSTLQKVVVAVFLIAVIGGVAYGFGLFNRPPKAAFTYHTPTRTLKYIAPTDGDMILFLNNSTDPDGDVLTFQWFIRFNGTGDWKLMNSSRDHWGRLPVSNEKGHEIRLTVSDGMKEDFTSVILPVDPAWLAQYPEKKLAIPTKGINMNIGCSYDIHRWPYNPEFPPVGDEEIAESLSVVKHELGCNAVRLFGNEDDRMVRAVEIAIFMKFKVVMVSPRYIQAAINETIRYVTQLAIRLEKLRSQTSTTEIILNIGNEMTYDTLGLVPGETYDDRAAWADKNWDRYTSKLYQDGLNVALRAVIESARKQWKGRITYSKHVGETVDWNGIGFDVVSANEYYATMWDTEPICLERISKLCEFDRTVHLTEFGYYTFDDCLKYGGGGYWYVTRGWWNTSGKKAEYSQETQARGIVTHLELLNRSRIDALYIWALIEKKVDDIASDGILRYFKDGLQRRKLGFYAYQSFTLL